MLKPIFTFLAASLLLVGTASAETVKLALIDPLTGPMAAAGQPAFEHPKYEAKRTNPHGGPNGQCPGNAGPGPALLQPRRRVEHDTPHTHSAGLRHEKSRAECLAGPGAAQNKGVPDAWLIGPAPRFVKVEPVEAGGHGREGRDRLAPWAGLGSAPRPCLVKRCKFREIVRRNDPVTDPVLSLIHIRRCRRAN